MLFPLWKLVNQLQRQFPYTVWFYCVWPGHLISISSCWEQRVNFISSLSLMQTAWEAAQGIWTAVGGRKGASSGAGQAASVSRLKCDAKILLLTEMLVRSPVKAYFLNEQGMWRSIFLLSEIFTNSPPNPILTIEKQKIQVDVWTYWSPKLAAMVFNPASERGIQIALSLGPKYIKATNSCKQFTLCLLLSYDWSDTCSPLCP